MRVLSAAWQLLLLGVASASLLHESAPTTSSAQLRLASSPGERMEAAANNIPGVVETEFPVDEQDKSFDQQSAELDYLRLQIIKLQAEISEREDRLGWNLKQAKPDSINNCDGFGCILRYTSRTAIRFITSLIGDEVAFLDRHQSHTRGNQSHGNHTHSSPHFCECPYPPHHNPYLLGTDAGTLTGLVLVTLVLILVRTLQKTCVAASKIRQRLFVQCGEEVVSASPSLPSYSRHAAVRFRNFLMSFGGLLLLHHRRRGEQQRDNAALLRSQYCLEEGKKKEESMRFDRVSSEKFGEKDDMDGHEKSKDCEDMNREEETLSMSREIASFRSVVDMVSDMVAAEEGRRPTAAASVLSKVNDVDS
ncbi:hypothetical protein B0H66DRAFT_233418 [Apodospora peruviana]|uniref:Uncharacterized protein n=1 Tax=Apodospora peruviana TaxID=516989 RepID=A0AAE0M583_9PEZI|nr:hypothetical protein B0H66DRAFT_233418 [Apodospora peruviana]